jgi:hypothetical protein
LCNCSKLLKRSFQILHNFRCNHIRIGEISAVSAFILLTLRWRSFLVRALMAGQNDGASGAVEKSRSQKEQVWQEI